MNFLFRSFITITALTLLPLNSFAVSVSFDLEKTGSTLQPRHLAGTCLPIWNKSSTYNKIQKGLAQSHYRLFRFPNGSLSNGYHWNGTGSYTADSIWVCDSQTCTPGFMSMTLRRGTSVSNWGFDSYSNITDGDTATYWRSDELISESEPYFYLDLYKAAVVDSIVIYWGARCPVDFDIDFFTKTSCPYPGPFGYPDDLWENQLAITNNDRLFFADTISGGKSTRYVRIRVKKFKDSEKSVEAKEVYLFSQDSQVTKNVKSYGGEGTGNQTYVIAMPTFIGSTKRPGTESWTSWHFESFMTYLQSISDSSVPVITVNYSTGTPEEAAAWVYYANIVKNYKVKFWQIGNELDGAWEDGGPITAKMYAEKFLRFSKAMKQVDSTIKVFGPLLSNADFSGRNSGLYDGRSWMKAFIDIVGRAEKTDGRKYCDGIDFHTYPYWATSITSAGMMQSADYVYRQSDSLIRWMDSSLVAPESVFVMMSEFNSMTILSDILMKPINGIFVANLYAGLADKFGSRAMSVFWDSFEEGDVGSNKTFGSLSLFNAAGTRVKSSLGYAPSAAYWALFTAQNLWIDQQKDNSVVHATIDSAAGIRAYGIKTADDFRALLFNISFSSVTVSCLTSGDEFDSVDIITWGESQFTWRGSDQSAFALPSCGPSSKTFSKLDFKDITLPGISMCVLRYRDAASAGHSPRFLHILHAPSTDTALVLALCGSVFSGGPAITAIAYAFDSAATFSNPVRSIDSAFDGPFESFFDSLSLRGLTSGVHTLYIQARNGAGATTIDSVIFAVSSLPAVHPARKSVGNGWQITEQLTRDRIRFTIDSPLRTGRQLPITARVFALNGTRIKALTGQGHGRNVIEWTGETGVGRKSASGVYFLIVSAGPKIIYQTTVMINK